MLERFYKCHCEWIEVKRPDKNILSNLIECGISRGYCYYSAIKGNMYRKKL